jgi:predicted GH43/DUF377 family glycosyl hydrolase
MHRWGDDFDWEGLNDAINYIESTLVTWGRINVHQAKEKYGTARIYCSLGWHQFHSITHPRTVYSRYPQWLWELDIDYGTKIVPFLFGWVVHYHAWLYRKTYANAVKKYPHLKEEILCCADYSKLLEGI